MLGTSPERDKDSIAGQLFAPGGYAYDKQNKARVQILSVSDVWNVISYGVYRPTDGAVYKISADALTADAGATKPIDGNYIRYAALLSKIKNEISGGVLLSPTSGVIPLPHQRYALERVLGGDGIRYILADEVGLGKTIEARLIIKELKTRGLIKRTLIVCPTGLVTQWSTEMSEKFGETFHIILPDEYQTIRKITESDDVYGRFDQIISPMDSIKPLEKHVGWTQERVEKYNDERINSVVNSGWDLVIIDEAHRVAGSSGEVARHKLGSLLAAASPYILLLTATPHNGKTEPFLRLVRLLDKDAFPSYDAIVKEQVAPFVIRTEKREAIDNNGNRLFKNRITKAVNLVWDERHSLQRELYEKVTEYVSHSYNKAMRSRGKNMWFIFLLIMFQRLVSSSTSAIRESMERRVKALEAQETQLRSMSDEEFTAMELETNMDDAIAAMSLDIKTEIAELGELVNIARQAEYQYQDVKVEALLNIADGIFHEERESKVIIFTEFVATQVFLCGLLSGRGYKVCALNGSMGIDERNEVLEKFKTECNIMISTDAGGEGLNLQFSNCVINYDLPWNPMKIEQRIGRVDRIGQTRDVTAYNFVLTDTIESHVREVLEEKLSAILNELGADKYADVLDSETAEVNYTDAYMRTLRSPKDIKYTTVEVEEDFKRQVSNSLVIRDLITKDKELEPHAVTDGGFDLNAALSLMLTAYDGGAVNSMTGKEVYGINDPAIARHLNTRIEFEPNTPLAVLSIKNFPNEPGHFILWELSIDGNEQSSKYIPVFINDNFTLRPLAGRKIWDSITDSHSTLSVTVGDVLPADIYETLASISRDYAYESFVAFRDETLKRRGETHRKYMYSLKLRTEAAERIRIENIRKSKLARLSREKADVERDYEMSRVILPEFRPILLIKMEGGDVK